MGYPRETVIQCAGPRGANLKHSYQHGCCHEDQEADPMAKGSSREGLDRISLCLSCKFVPVPGDNEKVLDVFADDFAVVAPEWCDSIEEKGECV